MKGRCLNPNNERYPSYGGRGIKVCEKWMTFAGFHEDMGDRPAGTTLHRVCKNSDYEPGNCVWSPDHHEPCPLVEAAITQAATQQ